MSALQEGGQPKGKVSYGKQNSLQMMWSLSEPPSSHAVVRFKDVLEKSRCQPMEKLVDVVQEFPDHVEYVYMPSSVPLRRCSGCCSNEEEKCRPTSLRNVTLQVWQLFTQTHFLLKFTSSFFFILLLASSGEPAVHDVVSGSGTHIYRTSSVWMQVSLTNTKILLSFYKPDSKTCFSSL